MKSGNWLAYLCFLGLPALAVGVVTCGFCWATLGTGWSPLAVIPLGLVIGIIVMAVGIAASGNDMADFAVTSLIVIALTVILMPVFLRARENTQRRMHKNAIRKALRERGAIYPQHMQKGTQPRG